VWAYVPVIGHSIEPTGIAARTYTVGTVSVIAGVAGALPPAPACRGIATRAGVQGHCHRTATASMRFTGIVLFRFPGFEVFEDMVRKLFASSKVLELDFGVYYSSWCRRDHTGWR